MLLKGRPQTADRLADIDDLLYLKITRCIDRATIARDAHSRLVESMITRGSRIDSQCQPSAPGIGETQIPALQEIGRVQKSCGIAGEVSHHPKIPICLREEVSLSLAHVLSRVAGHRQHCVRVRIVNRHAHVRSRRQHSVARREPHRLHSGEAESHRRIQRAGIAKDHRSRPAHPAPGRRQRPTWQTVIRRIPCQARRHTHRHPPGSQCEHPRRLVHRQVRRVDPIFDLPRQRRSRPFAVLRKDRPERQDRVIRAIGDLLYLEAPRQFIASGPVAIHLQSRHQHRLGAIPHRAGISAHLQRPIGRSGKIQRPPMVVAKPGIVDRHPIAGVFPSGESAVRQSVVIGLSLADVVPRRTRHGQRSHLILIVHRHERLPRARERPVIGRQPQQIVSRHAENRCRLARMRRGENHRPRSVIKAPHQGQRRIRQPVILRDGHQAGPVRQ